MSEIQVTTATLRTKADELSQLNEQFRNAVNALSEEEQALRTGYEGESSNAFHAAFSKDIIQMNNFYNAIERYVAALQEIASRYETAENTNTSIATERKY